MRLFENFLIELILIISIAFFVILVAWIWIGNANFRKKKKTKPLQKWFNGYTECRVCGKKIYPEKRGIIHYGISGWAVCEKDYNKHNKWFMEKSRTHEQFKIDIHNDWPMLEFQPHYYSKLDVPTPEEIAKKIWKDTQQSPEESKDQ